MEAPKACHLQAVCRLLKYVKSTCGQGLLLSAKSNMQLTTYCDADRVVAILLVDQLLDFVLLLMIL